jgi:D-serine deaminase-like pyridoxal phosphate-dependent protein
MIDVTNDPCAGVESGWSISRTLRPNPLTPAVARRLARELCRERRLCRAVADSVEMAAGELVSLSVQQARSPVTLTIAIDRGDIAIEVRDGGQRLPT